MKISNYLRDATKKIKWIIIWVIIALILLGLRAILNNNGIDGFNTMIDMSVGSTFTIIAYLSIYYKNARDLAIERKTIACPYFKICNKNKLGLDVIESADKIKLKVPIRVKIVDNAVLCQDDENEMTDSSIKEDTPFYNCTTELVIKNYNHADFIIDSLAFIVKKNGNDVKNTDSNKIIAYRICNPEYEYYIEKDHYYSIVINMNHADKIDGKCEGIMGLAVIDTTPESNKYFFPIIYDYSRYYVGERLEISAISNAYYKKAPENLVSFFNGTIWLDN